MHHKLPRRPSGLSQVVSTVFPETYEEDGHSSDSFETGEAASPQAFSGSSDSYPSTLRLSEEQMFWAETFFNVMAQDEKDAREYLKKEKGLDYDCMSRLINEIKRTGCIQLNETNRKCLLYIFPGIQFSDRNSDNPEAHEAASAQPSGGPSEPHFYMVAFPEIVISWASAFLEVMSERRNEQLREQIIKELEKIGLVYKDMRSVLHIIKSKGYIQLNEINERYVRYVLNEISPRIDFNSLKTVNNKIVLEQGQDLLSYRFTEEQQGFAERKAKDCRTILSGTRVSGIRDKLKLKVPVDANDVEMLKNLESSLEILSCIARRGRINLKSLPKVRDYGKENDIETLLRQFFIIKRC